MPRRPRRGRLPRPRLPRVPRAVSRALWLVAVVQVAAIAVLLTRPTTPDPYDFAAWCNRAGGDVTEGNPGARGGPERFCDLPDGSWRASGNWSPDQYPGWWTR